jgi:hypothetical protein
VPVALYPRKISGTNFYLEAECIIIIIIINGNVHAFRVLCWKQKQSSSFSLIYGTLGIFYHMAHKYRCLLEHGKALFCRFYTGNQALQFVWIHATICIIPGFCPVLIHHCTNGTELPPYGSLFPYFCNILFLSFSDRLLSCLSINVKRHFLFGSCYHENFFQNVNTRAIIKLKNVTVIYSDSKLKYLMSLVALAAAVAVSFTHAPYKLYPRTRWIPHMKNFTICKIFPYVTW